MTSPRWDDPAATLGGLKSWWSAFSVRGAVSPREERLEINPDSIFGAPLHHVLKHSSVAISLMKEDGEPYVWGYIPSPVAKIGLHLKQHALETEGVFRVGGSEKRMRELQDLLDAPPSYGKSLDWSVYTVHDAAGVLRRYLNMMPEPIVPRNQFKKFCRVLAKLDLDTDTKIEKFRVLIKACPQANQYLMLYILDLLAMFERKSATNKMTAQNLAIVFQPAILNHPSISSKDDHMLAVNVIEFLIEHQDHFVLALSTPPPKDVSPEDLTTKISSEVESYIIIPSDSDEEVDEYHVHLGGGSLLAQTPTPATSNGFFSRIERRKRADRQPVVHTEELNPQTLIPEKYRESPTKNQRFIRNENRGRSLSQSDEQAGEKVSANALKDDVRKGKAHGPFENLNIFSRPKLQKRSASATNVSQETSASTSASDTLYPISSSTGASPTNTRPIRGWSDSASQPIFQVEKATAQDVQPSSSSSHPPTPPVKAPMSWARNDTSTGGMTHSGPTALASSPRTLAPIATMSTPSSSRSISTSGTSRQEEQPFYYLQNPRLDTLGPVKQPLENIPMGIPASKDMHSLPTPVSVQVTPASADTTPTADQENKGYNLNTKPAADSVESSSTALRRGTPELKHAKVVLTISART